MSTPIQTLFISPAIADDDALATRGYVTAFLHADQDGEFVPVNHPAFKWTIDKLKYALAILAWNGCGVPLVAADTKQTLVRKLDEAAQHFIQNKFIARELPPIGQFTIPTMDAAATAAIGLPSFNVAPAGGDRPVSEVLSPSRPAIGGAPVIAQRTQSSSSREALPAPAVVKKISKRKASAITSASDIPAVTPATSANGTSMPAVNSGTTTIGVGNLIQGAGIGIPIAPTRTNPSLIPLPILPPNNNNNILNPTGVHNLLGMNGFPLGPNPPLVIPPPAEVGEVDENGAKRVKSNIRVFDDILGYLTNVNANSNIFNGIVKASDNFDPEYQGNNLTPAGAGLANFVDKTAFRNLKVGDYIWIPNQQVDEHLNEVGEIGCNQLAQIGMSLWKINSISLDKSINCSRIMSLGNNIHPCLISDSHTINFEAPAFLMRISINGFNIINVDNTLVRPPAVVKSKVQSVSRQGNLLSASNAESKYQLIDLEFMLAVTDPEKMKPGHNCFGPHGHLLDASIFLTKCGQHADMLNTRTSISSSSSAAVNTVNPEFINAFGLYNQLWNTIRHYAVIVDLDRFKELMYGNLSVADRRTLSLLHFQKRDPNGNLKLPENFDEVNQLLLGFENVFACLFARDFRGCTLALRNRLQEMSQEGFNIPYITEIMHKNMVNMFYIVKTGTVIDYPFILEVKKVAAFFSETLNSVSFTKIEQAELANSTKRIYNSDKYGIVTGAGDGSDKQSRKRLKKNLIIDGSVDGSGAAIIDAAKTAADLLASKAAAAVALAKSQKSAALARQGVLI
jgi:hypothetical protein